MSCHLTWATLELWTTLCDWTQCWFDSILLPTFYSQLVWLAQAIYPLFGLGTGNYTSVHSRHFATFGCGCTALIGALLLVFSLPIAGGTGLNKVVVPSELGYWQINMTVLSNIRYFFLPNLKGLCVPLLVLATMISYYTYFNDPSSEALADVQSLGLHHRSCLLDHVALCIQLLYWLGFSNTFPSVSAATLQAMSGGQCATQRERLVITSVRQGLCAWVFIRRFIIPLLPTIHPSNIVVLLYHSYCSVYCRNTHVSVCMCVFAFIHSFIHSFVRGCMGVLTYCVYYPPV